MRWPLGLNLRPRTHRFSDLPTRESSADSEEEMFSDNTETSSLLEHSRSFSSGYASIDRTAQIEEVDDAISASIIRPIHDSSADANENDSSPQSLWTALRRLGIVLIAYDAVAYIMCAFVTGISWKPLTVAVVCLLNVVEVCAVCVAAVAFVAYIWRVTAKSKHKNQEEEKDSQKEKMESKAEEIIEPFDIGSVLLSKDFSEALAIGMFGLTSVLSLVSILAFGILQCPSPLHLAYPFFHSDYDSILWRVIKTVVTALICGICEDASKLWCLRNCVYEEMSAVQIRVSQPWRNGRALALCLVVTSSSVCGLSAIASAMFDLSVRSALELHAFTALWRLPLANATMFLIADNFVTKRMSAIASILGPSLYTSAAWMQCLVLLAIHPSVFERRHVILTSALLNLTLAFGAISDCFRRRISLRTLFAHNSDDHYSDDLKAVIREPSEAL